MTDDAWVQEHIAAAVAGGLTAAEAERFDAHVRDCPECATALADARTLDRGLGTLFADVRPGPAHEDRTIHALRAAKARRLILSGWKGKLAAGIAASVGLGAIGAGVAQLAERGGLVFPGDPEADARTKLLNNLKQLAFATHGAPPSEADYLQSASAASLTPPESATSARSDAYSAMRGHSLAKN